MKKKYMVYGVMRATVFVGEYEADSKAEADEMADADRTANWNPVLCRHCAWGIELGDIYDTEVVGVYHD